MPLGFPNAPSALDDLVDLLESSGFSRSDSRQGGMDGVELTLHGSVRTSAGPRTIEVLVSGDRGVWTLGLRFEGLARFIEPRVWAAYLDRTVVAQRDLLEQVRFVSSRLQEAAIAASADEALEANLVRLGEDYMRRRLVLNEE